MKRIYKKIGRPTVYNWSALEKGKAVFYACLLDSKKLAAISSARHYAKKRGFRVKISVADKGVLVRIK